MVKLVFSYGIPPGSALILLSFLGIILALVALCIDYTEMVVGHSAEAYQLESGVIEVMMEMLILAELLINVTCLGFGAIIKGIRSLFLVWIISEGVFFVIWEIQLVWYLVEVISYYHDMSFQTVAVLLYLILYTAVYYGYQVNLAVNCLPHFTPTMSELEPIGKGLEVIWNHFKDNAKSAAGLALMSEIMMNFHIFLERHVTQYGMGFDYLDDEVGRSTALLLEETFVRYSRVIVCAVGFYLTYKEKQLWMFNWCLAYLVTLTVSLGIFVYMVFMWRAVHTFLTLVYFTTFTVNLLFRTGVLYLCVRYTDVFARQGIPL